MLRARECNWPPQNSLLKRGAVNQQANQIAAYLDLTFSESERRSRSAFARPSFRSDHLALRLRSHPQMGRLRSPPVSSISIFGSRVVPHVARRKGTGVPKRPSCLPRKAAITVRSAQVSLAFVFRGDTASLRAERLPAQLNARRRTSCLETYEASDPASSLPAARVGLGVRLGCWTASVWWSVLCRLSLCPSLSPASPQTRHHPHPPSPR